MVNLYQVLQTRGNAKTLTATISPLLFKQALQRTQWFINYCFTYMLSVKYVSLSNTANKYVEADVTD